MDQDPTLPPPLPRGHTKRATSKSTPSHQRRGVTDTLSEQISTTRTGSPPHYQNLQTTTIQNQQKQGGTAGNIYICAPVELQQPPSPILAGGGGPPALHPATDRVVEAVKSSPSLSKPWMASPGSNCYVSSSSSATSKSGNPHITSDRYVFFNLIWWTHAEGTSHLGVSNHTTAWGMVR